MRVYVIILWGVSLAITQPCSVVWLTVPTQLQFPDTVTWKHVKDLVRSIIGGEPKRADIPLLNVRPRRALVEILGEEDALKAKSKLLHVPGFGQA